MLLFAQDSFWKVPSFWDLAGFAIGLFSILLAIFYARRDIKQRIEEARREAKAEAERASRLVVYGNVKSTVDEIRHACELGIEALKGDRFERASEYIASAGMRLVQVKIFFDLNLETRELVADSQENLRVVEAALRNPKRKTPGRLQTHEREKLLSTISAMIRLASNLELQIGGIRYGE